MDMNHDFRPDPDFRIEHIPTGAWLPEAYAIGGIFLALWLVLVRHVAQGGVSW
ncbi:hypothetical protein [Novosphingobium sp. BL-52-GroH]|uniref:hypothetical protein n=1 Tax=Novosphingobium sp. BL-52-GroH TaxID=3349877 RepID=UPI00384C8F8C